MTRVRALSETTVTRVRTQSIQTITASVATTVSAAMGSWVATSTTWRSSRASEVIRAASSPVPWVRTTASGRRSACSISRIRSR